MNCENRRSIWQEHRQYTVGCPKTNYDGHYNVSYVRNVVLNLVGNCLDLLTFQRSYSLNPHIGVLNTNGNEVIHGELTGSVDNRIACINIELLSCFIEVRAFFVELFVDLLKQQSNISIQIQPHILGICLDSRWIHTKCIKINNK